ncbi:hypothetical protein [Dipodfec virus UA06Rod_22]|uniref:Uncharacterized protein n=1 Tax=Dipodfec virus UA06Rod_22 TaxID=2929322 RepID=A0A976R5E2_9VIRU|nr:hypothetical protein [Dipodfec virus UA06Rod_22]
MPEKKIQKITICAVFNGDLSNPVPLHSVRNLCNVYSVTSGNQPANPMVPGSRSMSAVKVELNACEVELEI